MDDSSSVDFFTPPAKRPATENTRRKTQNNKINNDGPVSRKLLRATISATAAPEADTQPPTTKTPVKASFASISPIPKVSSPSSSTAPSTTDKVVDNNDVDNLVSTKCPICGRSLAHMDAKHRNLHVNSCLDGGETDVKHEQALVKYKRTIPCPMCSVPLDDTPFRQSHLKSCARAFGMSPSQVAQLAECQQSVCDARAASGFSRHERLPAPPRREQFEPKRRSHADVPKSVQSEQLQLAQALSVSSSSTAAASMEEDPMPPPPTADDGSSRKRSHHQHRPHKSSKPSTAGRQAVDNNFVSEPLARHDQVLTRLRERLAGQQRRCRSLGSEKLKLDKAAVAEAAQQPAHWSEPTYTFSVKLASLERLAADVGSLLDEAQQSSSSSSVLRVCCADGVVLRAHGCIVRARSAALANLANEFGDVDLIGERADVVRRLLQYLYTGRCDALQAEHASQLLQLATRLRLADLATSLSRQYGLTAANVSLADSSNEQSDKDNDTSNPSPQSSSLDRDTSAACQPLPTSVTPTIPDTTDVLLANVSLLNQPGEREQSYDHPIRSPPRIAEPEQSSAAAEADRALSTQPSSSFVFENSAGSADLFDDDDYKEAAPGWEEEPPAAASPYRPFTHDCQAVHQVASAPTGTGTPQRPAEVQQAAANVSSLNWSTDDSVLAAVPLGNANQPQSHTTDDVPSPQAHPNTPASALRRHKSAGSLHLGVHSAQRVLGSGVRVLKVGQHVTPRPDFAGMDTPQLKRELSRHGLRSFARKRALVLLNQTYDNTHPVIPGTEPEPNHSLPAAETDQKNSSGTAKVAAGSRNQLLKEQLLVRLCDWWRLPGQRDLLMKALMFEAVPFEQVLGRFNASLQQQQQNEDNKAGSAKQHRLAKQPLLDWLDDQGITYVLEDDSVGWKGKRSRQKKGIAKRNNSADMDV